MIGIFDNYHGRAAEFQMGVSMHEGGGFKIGIGGRAPSDFPEFAEFLVECGIDSMGVIPDTAIKTRLIVAKKEKELVIK